jgi:hypothetical protein
MREVTAEELGRQLANRFLEPEACRREADALRDQPRPDAVGCCEMAFARAAVLKFVIGDTQDGAIAARINSGIDAVVAQMFHGAHTPETAAWYGPGDLGATAAQAINNYQGAAFWSARLAKIMAERLGLARPSPLAAKGFADLTEAVVVTITKVRIR